MIKFLVFSACLHERGLSVMCEAENKFTKRVFRILLIALIFSIMRKTTVKAHTVVAAQLKGSTPIIKKTQT